MIEGTFIDWERISTKEGWDRFVAATAAVPPTRLSATRLASLKPGDKADYDQQRIIYASSMPPITSLYESCHEEMEVTMRINAHRAPGARPGIVIDGNPHMGKTTIVTEFGRKHDLLVRKAHPGKLTSRGHERHPTVYANVDAYPTIKGVNRALLNFWGHAPRRATTHEMTDMILDLVAQCETSLIILDDVHMIDHKRDSDRDVNNHLKRLANDVKATFVYAGVGLENRGFMHEGLTASSAKFSQLSRRFKLIPASPLLRGDDEDEAMLSGVLNVYEQLLPLANSRSGDLVGLAEYVWKRTQGVIGSISQLVTEAFVRAILDGSERITKRSLSRIVLGHAAEMQFDNWRTKEHPKSLLASS